MVEGDLERGQEILRGHCGGLDKPGCCGPECELSQSLRVCVCGRVCVCVFWGKGPLCGGHGPASLLPAARPGKGVSQLLSWEAGEPWGCHGAGARCLLLPSPTLLSPCSGHAVEEVDNTLTLIILAVVGGIIGLLIVILLVKKFIAFTIKKTQEKK